MALQVTLFLMMGVLLLGLGAALAVRSYRETRGITAKLPVDKCLLWLKRGALALYVMIAVVLVVSEVHRDDTGVRVSHLSARS